MRNPSPPPSRFPSTLENLSGLGKSLGIRGWISQYLPRFGGAQIHCVCTACMYIYMGMGPQGGLCTDCMCISEHMSYVILYMHVCVWFTQTYTVQCQPHTYTVWRVCIHRAAQISPQGSLCSLYVYMCYMCNCVYARMYVSDTHTHIQWKEPAE